MEEIALRVGMIGQLLEEFVLLLELLLLFLRCAKTHRPLFHHATPPTDTAGERADSLVVVKREHVSMCVSVRVCVCVCVGVCTGETVVE
jgi:hypothetical protein